MKATVDKDLCIGCELCTQICPSFFSMAVDGVAHALAGTVPPEDEACCSEAAEGCPVKAIAVTG
jgi:ferredoxin